MDNSDEQEVHIDADRVVVNTGWTTEMAKWNTIGTIGGMVFGAASLLVSIVTLAIVLKG